MGGGGGGGGLRARGDYTLEDSKAHDPFEAFIGLGCRMRVQACMNKTPTAPNARKP